MENNQKHNLSIAMFGQKRIPSREGGIEVVVEELSTRMVELGYDVTCYNRTGHHVSGAEYDTSKINEYKGVKIKNTITIDRKGLAALTSSISAAWLTAFGGYDIVHIHAEGPAAMCWLPKLFGKKVIVTIHGLDHQRAKWGKFASKYIMMGEKAAVKYADEIIVLSKGVQEYFLNTYNRKTEFIPNGVSKPIIREAEIIKNKWQLCKDSYILFLGRLVPEKGIGYLLDAWKNIKTDKKLVIAGGSSDTVDFANELKTKADDRVIFTGFVQGAELEELYSNAYVYCLPSDLEGMPLSLLEAMSYGNCCLCSNIEECLQVIGEHGISFEKSNINDLSKVLQTLCDNRELVARYKSEAQDYILKKYNWDDVVKKTLDLYFQ